MPQSYAISPSILVLPALAEGFLIPLASSEPFEAKLASFFDITSKYNGCCGSGIDEEDAARIDSLLATHPYAARGESLLKVDRQRLSDSWEAWLHVTIAAHQPHLPNPPHSAGDLSLWPFTHLPSSEAILTWTNSD